MIYNPCFDKWNEHLIPVTIKKDVQTGNKEVIPNAWKDGQVYRKFSKNSVGMRTGGITANVVDVDTKDLSLLTEPFKSWVEERLLLEDTLIVESKNGYHIYFYSPDFKLRTTTKTGRDKSTIPYIDFRGEGGMIFVHSNSDVASYEVLCDEEPTTDIEEILPYLPEWRERVEVEDTEVGFENLDDPEDKAVLKVGDKKTIEEIQAMLDTVSSGTDRTTWMENMASAYNLIDTQPERLKDVLREWSKKGATEEHQYSDSGFEHAWEQISSGKFGKSFKGGTLVVKAREEEISTSLGKAENMDDLEEVATLIQGTRLKGNKRDEFLDELCTKSKEITGKPERVKWRNWSYGQVPADTPDRRQRPCWQCKREWSNRRGIHRQDSQSRIPRVVPQKLQRDL